MCLCRRRRAVGSLFFFTPCHPEHRDGSEWSRLVMVATGNKFNQILRFARKDSASKKAGERGDEASRYYRSAFGFATWEAAIPGWLAMPSRRRRRRYLVGS